LDRADLAADDHALPDQELLDWFAHCGGSGVAIAM
jgi:hypothetical protein